MNITVVTDSWARRCLPQERTEVALPEGATVADALAGLGVPEDEIGLTAVNGRAAPREAALCGGDVLKIFPVVIGG